MKAEIVYEFLLLHTKSFSMDLIRDLAWTDYYSKSVLEVYKDVHKKKNFRAYYTVLDFAEMCSLPAMLLSRIKFFCNMLDFVESSIVIDIYNYETLNAPDFNTVYPVYCWEIWLDYQKYYIIARPCSSYSAKDCYRQARYSGKIFLDINTKNILLSATK